AWLLLVSALAVVNSVGLSRLTEQSQASAQDAHVQAINTRVAELEQQAAASKNQPKPVTQPDFEAARKTLDERLAQVEQAQAGDTQAGDFQALQARVGDIEARMKRTAAPVAIPRRAAEPAKPKVPEPPFNVVGVELRGGERFLSVAAPSRLLNFAAMRVRRLVWQAFPMNFGIQTNRSERVARREGAHSMRFAASSRTSLRYRTQYSRHSDEIRGGHRQLEVLIDLPDSPVDGLPDAPDRLAPAEVLLD